MKLWSIPLVLALLALAIPAPAAASDDCGASCLEDCQVVVRAVSARAGCTIAHTPHYVETDCAYGDCDWVIASCGTEVPGYCVGESMPNEPICQQLFVGPDIDQGVCAHPGARPGSCRVWYYSYYGTGPNYCIVP